ncbi:Arylsulfatase [Flagellimonas maritima]|uniref:Arylsulfatase n=1 Tax=Flagellimonas maritima TaxID=1383885 RepID=A0A2Z4LQI9_9FLAO|nr:arylsulfatase [Allomuricauda aurantiaca]AWX43668.1 Arylsulfatase [Allomuricauda aurantiaca]
MLIYFKQYTHSSLTILSLSLLFFISSCKGQKKEYDKSRPPNIVIILADDLGYGDIGYYNENSLIPTSNLDKLASEGISLTNAYCPIAVCSPTRYALMTGTYPWRSWNESGVMRNYERSMIEKDQLTLPAMLKQNGYVTAGFGKWHLGTSFQTTDGQHPVGYGMFKADKNGANLDITKPVHDGPIDHGFDKWLGFSCASECWILDGKKIVAILDHPYYTTEAAQGTEHLEAIAMEDYLSYITNSSLNFIREQSTETSPFFLYFAPYVPHTPLAPSENFKNKTQAGQYGDYVNELDDSVGQLLNALAENNLTDNTIVLFASDNGSAFKISYKGIEDSDKRNRGGGHPVDIDNYPTKESLNPNGFIAHYPNGNLKGAKSTAWEGGVRTPLIVRWPKQIPAGIKSHQLFALNDVMPSLAGILNIVLPDDAALDGFDLTGVLKGEYKGLRRSVIVQSSNNIFGLRMGKWKFIHGSKRDHNSATDELYDLSIDPSESKNLLKESPEIAKMMKRELLKLLNSKRTNFN